MNNEKSQSNNEKPQVNNEKAQGKFDQVNKKIKAAWPKLSDSDVALYATNRGQFLGKLQAVDSSLTKETAETKLKAIEDACGCSSNNKAA